MRFIWIFAVFQEIIILIEHSENRIITQSGMFENEIGPRILQSSIQQTRALEEYKRHKLSATRFVSTLSKCCVKFSQIVCFLNTGLELFRSNLVLEIRIKWVCFLNTGLEISRSNLVLEIRIKWVYFRNSLLYIYTCWWSEIQKSNWNIRYSCKFSLHSQHLQLLTQKGWLLILTWYWCVCDLAVLTLHL